MQVIRIGICLTVLALAASRARAQPENRALADTTVHGSAEVGYRSTTVSGSLDSYRQLFDLSDGPRLLNAEFRGEARGAKAWADDFAFSASGIGDPFATVQFTMRKSQRYDLRVNWRNSRFIDTAPLTPPSLGGLDTQAVTNRHAWTTTRQIGDVSVVYDATSSLHLLFNYSRVARTGALASTRSLDFVGSPTVWGAFARANPYPVTSPVDDTSNRVTGGLSYSAAKWTLNYQAGLQRYDESQRFSPLASAERSINVADPTTAPELLNSLSLSQSRSLSSPVSDLSFVARPSAKIEWRGGYQFYRYSGPFNLNAAYEGIARTNTGGTTFSPYDVTLTASGTASSPNHLLHQAITYRLTDQWAIDAEYRYARYATDAQGLLGSVLGTFPTGSPGPARASEEDQESWRQTQHAVDVSGTYTPSPSLTIRPGVRIARRDIEQRENGIADPALSERINTVSPEVTVGFRPVPQFTARASYRVENSDAWYTRLSPTEQSIGRVLVRVEPVDGFAIEATANQTDAELPAASFVSHSRFGSLQASYRVGERVSAFGGVDYQSFLGLGNVSFLRGAAPIADDEMRDEERDRIWLVGARVKVTRRLGITASANFLRSNGSDTIAGEPPLYGPETFPYGTGSISYDIPGAGRVSVDLQRAHLYQDILSSNDFRATLLTLRFSREF